MWRTGWAHGLQAVMRSRHSPSSPAPQWVVRARVYITPQLRRMVYRLWLSHRVSNADNSPGVPADGPLGNPQGGGDRSRSFPDAHKVISKRTCQVFEIHPDDTHLCNIADPCGIVGGARRIVCEGEPVATGKVGERLCRKHAEEYPEPQALRLL